MALGDILRKARESRKLTASQVAQATHMKVQTVEAIEREDFSRMPAAIYCKGFIKLYAEYMGLDPDPLTREYVERFVEPPPPPEPEEPEEEHGARFNMGSFTKKDDLPPIAQEAEEEAEAGPPDLWDFAKNRTEEPPEKLFDHTPPKKEEEEEPEAPSISDRLSGISSKIADTATSVMGRLRRPSEELAQDEASPQEVPEVSIQPDSEVDVSPITLPNRQILIISGAVAGVILMVFLISVIAGRLSDGGGKIGPDDVTDQDLVLPVDPPAPYID